MDFLRELKPSDQMKMQALFDRAADHWPITNWEKFHQLDGELLEFKSHQIRMPCFERRGPLVLVTHGFIKKQDKAPKAEIQRGLTIVQTFDADAAKLLKKWPYNMGERDQ